MSETAKYPFFIRLAAILLCLIGLFVILYFGGDIIFPILLSLLFAIILRPIVTFLIKRLRFTYFIAVVFAIVFFIVIFLGVFYFISLQITDMVNDWEKIKSNFYFHIEYFQQLISDNFHLSNIEQKEIIGNAAKNSLKSGNQIVGITISSFSDIVLNLTLIPIYTFLFLLYQNHFIAFLTKLYKPQNHKKLREILFEIKTAVQSYVAGLIFEMIAVSFLTSIGLYLIGVEYFILLGIITGILNLIPYVGILFAGVLSIVVSLSGSTDLSVALGVIVVNLIVQFLDNNILIPMLVNSKVQINAFASIIGIIIGNVLGGITGMFLAIPIIAIIKVIFDRIDHLEPWGYLLGDDVPKTYEWHNIKLPHYNYQTSSTTIDFDTDFTPSIQSEDSAENDGNSTNDTVDK